MGTVSSIPKQNTTTEASNAKKKVRERYIFQYRVLTEHDKDEFIKEAGKYLLLKKLVLRCCGVGSNILASLLEVPLKEVKNYINSPIS